MVRVDVFVRRRCRRRLSTLCILLRHRQARTHNDNASLDIDTLSRLKSCCRTDTVNDVPGRETVRCSTLRTAVQHLLISFLKVNLLLFRCCERACVRAVSMVTATIFTHSEYENKKKTNTRIPMPASTFILHIPSATSSHRAFELAAIAVDSICT